MFTGLIEAIGSIEEVSRTETGLRLRIRTALAPELKPGDSLAVNGVCLTAAVVGSGDTQADIGPETARVTTLGSAREGQEVNLERALRADGRIGGHFVQGHVDGMGRVEEIRSDGEAHWLTVSFPAALAPWLIPKGSVAVDGISLTVAALDEARFTVMIVPFTWAHTAVRTLRTGDAVNLECDMVGKYVNRALEVAAAGRSTG